MLFQNQNLFEFVEASEAGNCDSDNELEEEPILHYDSESDNEADQAVFFGDPLGGSEHDECMSSQELECEDSEFLDDESQDLLEECEADSTNTYEFITNQMGNDKLYANGFGFYRRRTTGASTSWKCEFFRNGCSASATTIKLDDGGSNMVRIKNIHNHVVDLDRKEKFIGR